MPAARRSPALGRLLQHARKARRLSLADVAGTTWSLAYVRAVERGGVAPAPLALELFSRRLAIPLAELVAADAHLRAAPDLAAIAEDLEFQLKYATGQIQAGQPAAGRDLVAVAAATVAPYWAQLPPQAQYRVPYVRALSYLAAGEPQPAQTTLETALALAQPDPVATLWVRNLLGVALYQQEHPHQALAHHLACVQAVRQGLVRDLNLRVSSYRNLANDHWALNDMAQAIAVYQEILPWLEHLNDPTRAAGIYWGLALAYNAQDDWPRALLYTIKAREIYAAADDFAAATAISLNLAEILITRQAYPEVTALLEQVQRFLARSGDAVLLSSAAQTQAELARVQGQWEQATRFAQQSRAIDQLIEAAARTSAAVPPNTWRAYAEALHTSARIAADQGQHMAADAWFTAALTAGRHTGFRETVFKITLSYAEVLQARGAFAAATAYYQAACALRPSSRP